MAASGVSVRVFGLHEVRAAMTGFHRELPDLVDEAAHDAADVVAKGARREVPLGPARNGHARDSIQSSRKGNAWQVTGGGPRFPYYPWLDFGGKINERTSQPTVRAFFKKGRYIYPAYERYGPEINRIMSRALTRHAEAAGLEMR